VTASEEDRARRLAEIGAELATLEKLQARVRTLLPGETPGQAPATPRPVAAGR
jgi:hypothetical protein